MGQFSSVFSSVVVILTCDKYSKVKMELMGRSAARVTIEDYYSKTYFENLVKCVIYKGNETVISNDDDRHWLTVR